MLYPIIHLKTEYIAHKSDYLQEISTKRGFLMVVWTWTSHQGIYLQILTMPFDREVKYLIAK